MKILNRYTGKLILEIDNLSGANLRCANLSGANLSDANLSDANLFNCTGNNKEIKTLQFYPYVCNYTKDILWIGCKHHRYDEWFNFNDSVIAKMDSKAIEFWNKYKDLIKSISISFEYYK